MYRQLEGGKIIDIQGLLCCLPPEGYVYNIITNKIEYRGVYKRSEIPTEQYWEKPKLPDWYLDVMKQWDLYDKKKKEDDADFYDERLEEFKRQEWDRRLNGFWYMNYNPKTEQSEATYLTGMYYMLLRWWIIDVGFADFTIPHLKKMYFLEYCIQDPVCFGMIDITKRRFLKTFIGGLFITERVSRTKSSNGGIQSKSGKDAKKVFSKAIVDPFRRLPRFFRPEYDMSLGVNPKTEMRFQKTNVRGKKAEETISKDELNSVIDWESADAIAYDGQKLFSYFGDEFAKTDEANVFDRHEVIRYCLLDHEGRIVGKALYSSTVEAVDNEKNDISKAAKQLWDSSDQNNRQENGQTESGLYRFFQTADEAKNFDKYGYPDVEKNIDSILKDRKAANNPRQLAGRIRKEPRTEAEAWLVSSDKCIFNLENLAEQEIYLKENPPFKREIWFYRDLDGIVKWRNPTERQKHFCWKFIDLPLQEDSNKFRIIGGARHPDRKQFGAISVDGISNSQGGEKWGSSICAWAGTRLDQFNPDSGMPTGMLYGRPDDINDCYEQILLCAEYHGWLVYWEFVADAYHPYFKDRGRVNYLALSPMITINLEKNHTPERIRGVPTTPYSLYKQNELGITYFNNYCHKIKWIELIEDAKDYDPNNRTAFDKTVSFLIWLVGITEPLPVVQKPKAPLIKTYSNHKHREYEPGAA